jgi:hypothetical protein
MMLPKKLMADIKQGSVDIAGEEVDLSDLQNSMEKGLTDQTNSKKDNTPQPQEQPAGEPNAAPVPNI